MGKHWNRSFHIDEVAQNQQGEVDMHQLMAHERSTIEDEQEAAARKLAVAMGPNLYASYCTLLEAEAPIVG